MPAASPAAAVQPLLLAILAEFMYDPPYTMGGPALLGELVCRSQ